MRFRGVPAIVFFSLVLAISAGLGGLLGQAPAPTKPGENVDSSLQTFTSILGLVQDNYATAVDSDTAVYGSIDGMLRTLDPHSHFFTPKEFAALREDQTGQYFGLGISIIARFGKVTVVSPPFKGSPAEKAGLRVGDVISEVNGEPTEGLDLTNVVSKLKGPRGTAVKIKVVRPGVDEPMEMSIVRDAIAKYTINSTFMIQPQIGYIKLDSFEDNTGQELRDALKKLDPKTLGGLIFDLRGNPGGVLPAAIETGETFLQKGQLILATKGRTRGSNVQYSSRKVNTENLFPIVVLIDQNSASAAEIVSGALQDHDRALIVGQTSFGKGLVQTVFLLSRNAAVALTTQKWYTPSGRLIQRDYSHISEFDYYNHLDKPAAKTDDIKHSDLGRVVYGGGGITPDYAVAEPKSNDFQDSMARHFVYFTFGRDFLAKNPSIDTSFQVSDALLAEFKQHLQKRNIPFTDKDFQDNKDYLKRAIRYEIVYDRLGSDAAARGLLVDDPQVLKAIELMPEAKALADKARQNLAQKAGSRQ